jgi:DNA-binding NarL/FixJ family response regulator
MSSQETVALIVCEIGPLRDGLSVLISAIPFVHLLGAVGTTRKAVQILNEKHPELVVVDSHLLSIEDTRYLLKEIKSCRPAIICVVVAGDVEQVQIAWEAGADKVQLTGCPASELYETIQGLLNARSRQN